MNYLKEYMISYEDRKIGWDYNGKGYENRSMQLSFFFG